MQKANVIKRYVDTLTRWCAYSHIYKVVAEIINGKKLSEETKTGRNIALLGIFCPFFWFALISGADASTIAFHAVHSSVVFLIGVVIMVISLIHK